MRKLVVSVVASLFVAPGLARAGDAVNSVQGQFYSFVAPVLSNTQYGGDNGGRGGYSTGFGGELLNHEGLGVGVEFGYAATLSYSGQGSKMGVGSADFTCHVPGNKSNRTIDPFLTGGYSLYFGERTTTQSGFNLGGGVNIWLSKHVAPRLEIRYEGGINGIQRIIQFNEYAAFRFGLNFR